MRKHDSAFTCFILAMLGMIGIAVASIPTVSVRQPYQALEAPTPMGTLQMRWQHMRTVTASDTELNGVTKAWETIKTKFLRITPLASFVRISCYADGDSTGEGDPNGGTFSWKLFVCDEFGSAQMIGYGTWAIGELALSHDPDPTTGTETSLTYATTDPNSSKYGERPVLTAPYFGECSVTGTTDDIGELQFDPSGCYGVWLEVTSLSGITNLHVMLKGY